MSSATSQPRDVSIQAEPIRLGQFLKLADLIDHGSEARPLLASGQVTVNGQAETRRGRQLTVGDVIAVGEGPGVRVVLGASDPFDGFS